MESMKTFIWKQIVFPSLNTANMQLTIESQIESILFFKGEPVSILELSKLLGISEVAVRDSLVKLEHQLENRGIQLISNDSDVTLSTHPEMSGFFKELTQSELTKDLSKAALETLSL